MTERAFIIGGTRFIGRHTVTELLDHGYEVTILTRGNRDNPFTDADRVTHSQGDRSEEGDLRLAADRADPDIVIDCVAYFPRDVRVATEVFAEVEAYVYVSSGAAYGEERVPKREGETPLESCTTEQATDDSWETYGPRKAEGDRAAFDAADDGVSAMVVRPPAVYGPYDYTERLDYWIDRVRMGDRVLVPGDGAMLRHMAYVEDVARGLRVVAERGTPGEAYNVGDRHLPVLDQWLSMLARACGSEPELVHAGERALAAGDLTSADFPLYRPYPHVLSTEKLARLGWDATPHDVALSRTVEWYLETDRTERESDRGPDPDNEERVLGVLQTMD